MPRCPRRRAVGHTPQLPCVCTLPCPELAGRGLQRGPRSTSTLPLVGGAPGMCLGSGGGEALTSSLRRYPTPKKVPHRVPNPATHAFRHVSRFGSLLHGVPNPTMQSFRVVSCFIGYAALELRLCQQQVHCLSRYACVLLCVLRQCKAPLDACTSHPKKKFPWGIDPSTTFSSISISSRDHANSGFPHLTNTQQLQQSGTFTISCQMTIIFLVSQN